MADSTAPTPDKRNHPSTSDPSDLFAAAERIIHEGGTDDDARRYIQAAISAIAFRWGLTAAERAEQDQFDHMLDREAHGCWQTGASWCYVCEQIRVDEEAVARIEEQRTREAGA